MTASRWDRIRSTFTGTPPSVYATQRAARSDLRVLEAVHSDRMQRLAEEMELADRLINPLERYAGTNGDRWLSSMGSMVDRKGGKNLPLVWTELDLREFRRWSRLICDVNPFAVGFLGLLTDFHIGKGYSWQACLRGAHKGSYATGSGEVDPLVAQCQIVLDEWRDMVAWPLKSREAFKRSRRDGEVFQRFFKGDWGMLPSVRFVDPSQVGPPPGDDPDGHWSFGVRTPPDDVEQVEAYWVRDPNGTGSEGVEVPSSRMIHLKANVDSGIKRGIPDFVPVQDDLERVRRLLRNMGEVAIVQAAIAYVRQYAVATKDQVTNLINAGADYTRQKMTSPGAGNTAVQNLEPGSVISMDQNMAYVPGPVAQGTTGFTQVEQAILRGCGARWRAPEYFSGDASNSNMASLLVAGAPFCVMVEGNQLEWGVYERSAALMVLRLAVESRRLPPEVLQRIDVEVKAPAVALAKKAEDNSIYREQNQAKVLSVTTWQGLVGLDPAHEAANFEAEAKRAQAQQPAPAAPAPPAPSPFGESLQLYEGIEATPEQYTAWVTEAGDAAHAIGDVWQADKADARGNRRWYTRRPDGKVVPAKDPHAAAKSAAAKKAKGDDKAAKQAAKADAKTQKKAAKDAEKQAKAQAKADAQAAKVKARDEAIAAKAAASKAAAEAKVKAKSDVVALVNRVGAGHPITAADVGTLSAGLAHMTTVEIKAVREALGPPKAASKAAQIAAVVGWATRQADPTALPEPTPEPKPKAPPKPKGDPKPAPKPRTPSTGSPAIDSLLASRDAASPAMRQRIDVVLGNLDVDPANPTQLGDHADRKAIARGLTSQWLHASNGGASPQDLAPFEVAMGKLGMKRIGTPGERVAFDGARHVTPDGTSTGSDHEIVQSGWELPDDSGRGTTIVTQAKTAVARAKEKPAAPKAVEVKTSPNGDRTTQFAPGEAEAAAKKLSPAIADALDHLKLFREYSSGMVPLGAVARQVQKAHPDASNREIMAAMSHLQKTRQLEGHGLNEVQSLSDPKDSVKPMPGAAGLDDSTLWRDGNAIHYWRLPTGKTSDTLRTAT